MPIHNVYPLGIPNSSPADLLAAAGLLLSIEINIPQSLASVLTTQSIQLPKPVTGNALVDTGASSCCVEESCLIGLGLRPIRPVTVSGQNGPTVQNIYQARLSFPGTPIPMLDIDVIGVQIASQNLLSLIGRDLLRHCVLIYNGPMGAYTLSF